MQDSLCPRIDGSLNKLKLELGNLLVPGWTFLILSNTAVNLIVAELLFQIKTLPEFSAAATNKPVKKQ